MTGSSVLVPPGLGSAQAFLHGPDQGEVWLGRRGAQVTVRARAVVEIQLLDGQPPLFDAADLDDASPILSQALEELAQYLQGRRRAFTFPIFMDGPPFFRKVWEELAKVPYGEVLTYGALASRAGKAGASRAAGTAMNRNKLPLVIPCHRVVAAGGKLGGFGCGVEWKKWLLRLERGEHPLTFSL